MSASISTQPRVRRACRRGAGPAPSTGVPCRLQPRNGTAFLRTLVASTAPSQQRPAPARRRRARRPAGPGRPGRARGRRAAASAGPRVASPKRRTAARRSPARSARRPATSAASAAAPSSASCSWSWPRSGAVAGQAGEEGALEQQGDGEVGRQRRRLERDLEGQLGGRHRAVGELEARAPGPHPEPGRQVRGVAGERVVLERARRRGAAAAR